MGRLGCFIILLLIALVAYFTRDSWLRFVPGRDDRRVEAVGSPAGPTWQPVTADGATRARKALDQLRSPRGPAYVQLTPGELGSHILQELSKSLPQSADSIEVAAIGERLHVRTVVSTGELGGSGALGPLSALLGERERIQMGGTLRIIRPGIAELQVKEMRIGNINLPQALIPRLVRQISRGVRPPELSPDGLPLQTPAYIGDVRVSDGRITLYKAIPTR